MRATINVELVRRATRGRLPPGDIRDARLRGFVLRVRASGTHTYFVELGRGRRYTLGRADVLTPAEARTEAQGLLGDQAKGRDPIDRRQAGRGQTFAAFVRDEYGPWVVTNRKTGADTLKRLESHFVALLGGTTLAEIAPFTIERWRSRRLRAGVTPITINRDVSVLSAALSMAVDWGRVPSHPLARLKPMKTDQAGGRVRYLTGDEEARLFAALAGRDDRRRAERDRANAWRAERGYPVWPTYGAYTDHVTPIVTLAGHTGLRRGELLGLRWGQVDLGKTPRLTVRGTSAKTGQTRHVPLNQVAADALTDWRDHADDVADTAPVFPNREGDTLADIKTAWRHVIASAGIADFRFHDLRHHFASRLVMAGVDLNTVRELLGHRDLKMTLRYAHLAPEHTAAAVAKLVVR